MDASCRLCGQALFPEPLLVQRGMPAAAQELPTAERLDQDRGVDLRLRQCRGCGVVQLDAPPVPYWRTVIRAAGLSPEMRSFRRTQFRDWIDRYRLAGQAVLEIGCGRGEYLALLAEAGVNAHGLEHAAEAVAACRSAGLAAEQGFLDGPGVAIAGAPFAGFAILSFLEHIPSAHRTLQGIAAQLDEDGAGLVEVPNFDLMLREGQFAEFIPDHLYYFTADTLVRLLEGNGFSVQDCRPAWHNYLLSAQVVRRRPLDLSGLAAGEDMLRQDFAAFLNRFPPGRVAVWGAGHQALALLSLLGFADRVRYVVDSAPFKQGRYTPATHLPIVPPGRLAEGEVDAVIVLAASYTDEVVSQLQARFEQRFAIAALQGHHLAVMQAGA